MLGPEVPGFLVPKLLGEDVQDDLEVAVGVEQAVVFLAKLFFELPVIRDVAVVGHDDAEGGVDLERLGVLASSAADRGIPGVADADRPPEALDILDGEDVTDEAVALLGVEAAVVRDDASRVLPPVLDGQQALVEVADDVIIAPDSDDSAHVLIIAELTRR